MSEHPRTAATADGPDPTADRGLPGWPALWFAVAGGQAAWAIALLVAYPMVQVACQLDLPILVHLVRWSAGVVAISATVVGYRAWRRVRAADTAGIETQAQRATLMAFGGMLLSGIAVFLLFVEDMATWVIGPCL